MPVCEVLHTSQGEMTHLQPCASSWPTEVSGCRRPLELDRTLCLRNWVRATNGKSVQERTRAGVRSCTERSKPGRGKASGEDRARSKADGTTSQKHFEKEIDPWMHGNIIR